MASNSGARRVAQLQGQLQQATATPASTPAPPLEQLLNGPSALYADCSDDSIRLIATERSAATFPVREMMHFLNGGRRMTECKERVAKELEEAAASIPAMDTSLDYESTLPEHRKRLVERIRVIYRLFMRDGGDVDMRQARVELAGLYSPEWHTRNGVHFGLFLSAIQSQGSPEQQAEWVPQALSLSIFGCFGMTELGHGSYVKGLETRCTFIPGAGPDGAGEWDLHTPTVTATKWWIGGAGQTATHCAVYARLITGGRDYGVHTFLAQLRDATTHMPLAGIRIGDIGPKMGRNGVDNGWIQFHHVRLPHSALLCRYANVDKAGVYSKPSRSSDKAGYGALILGRATMVQDSASNLQLATTIAVRWNALRRQGAPESTAAAAAAASGGQGEETQLLDFAAAQARLMPLLASAFAFNFTALRMRELYEGLQAGLAEEDLSTLPDVHATSSGLKAFCTWATHRGIDECRQACGGHGYSAYSRFPSLFADFAVMCSWEGANDVMALQTARYLMSSHNKALAKQELSGSVRYLQDRTVLSTCPAAKPEGLLDINTILATMRWRAKTAVLSCAAALSAAKAAGKSETAAWNACSVQLIDASRAHVYYNIAHWFALAVARRRAAEEAQLRARYSTPALQDPALAVPRPAKLQRAKKGRNATPAAAPAAAAAAPPAPAAAEEPVTGQLFPVLHDVLCLFALHTIQQDSACYLRYGFLNSTKAGWIEDLVKTLCEKVRSQAVALTDAFNLPPVVLNTPLAHPTGDAYRAYMQRVMAGGALHAGGSAAPAAAAAAAAAEAGPASGGAGGRVPVPYTYHPTPYFQDVIAPMIEGADLAMVTAAPDS